MSLLSYFLFVHRIVFFLALSACKRECQALGGQAVMEGIMMRNGGQLALAIRKSDGSIVVSKESWRSVFPYSWAKKPYVRGFPLLIDSMVNGIKALNLSAKIAAEEEGEKMSAWQICLSLFTAALLAVVLFVLVPHFVTVGLTKLKLAGGMEETSFHIWDGCIKLVMLLGYISLITCLPEIKRVFAYHGAEHKVIGAYESGEAPLTSEKAQKYSRMHPRCGTTFLLFVLCLSIFLHTLFVPGILYVWTPHVAPVKHFFILFMKLLLIIPISAFAYELIRFSARYCDSFFGKILSSPGMALQLLTTRTPNEKQLEVALVALHEALDKEALMSIPPYTLFDTNHVR